eukprot:4181408-Alexandrium_andersonii.AAC.1
MACFNSATRRRAAVLWRARPWQDLPIAAQEEIVEGVAEGAAAGASPGGLPPPRSCLLYTSDAADDM